MKDLLELKTNAPEVKTVPRIDALNEFLDESIQTTRTCIEQLPKERRRSWDELNPLFQSELEA